LKWFGQTNPSAPLITSKSILNFGFKFPECAIRMISVYLRTDSFRISSQYTNRFILHILSILQFNSAYSLNIHDKNAVKVYLIPHILCMCTDSFRVFSAYKQIHSMYSMYMYIIIPCIKRMRPINLNILKEHYFKKME
jgi:hypothetical protein